MPTCIQIIAAVVIYCGGPAPAPRTPAAAMQTWLAHTGGEEPRAVAPAAGLAPPDAFAVPTVSASTPYGLIPAGQTYAEKQAIVEANYQRAVTRTLSQNGPFLTVIVGKDGGPVAAPHKSER